MNRTNEKGITLIELMVVVIILGVLLVIVLPSFQASLQKGRRADAMSALLDVANRQEKFLLDRNTYTTDLAQLGYRAPFLSEDGHYTISVVAPDAGTCPLNRCYRILATPVASSPQANDSRCETFTLGSDGSRTATGSTADLCWQ